MCARVCKLTPCVCQSCLSTLQVATFIRSVNWALAVVSGKKFKITDEDISY